MSEHARHEYYVNDAVGGLPSPVSCNDDDGNKHQGETVVNGTKTSDEAQCVAVPNKKREGIAGLRTCKVVSCND